MTAPARTGAANGELLRSAGRGDQQAWTEIVLRYEGMVSAIVRSYRMQDADARDAEQRTWLRLVEHRGAVRDPERLGGWLATTASRECLRILRENRAVVSDELDAVPDAVPAVEDQVVDADTVSRLWTIVSDLPPRGRTIMSELFAENPRPYAEVARDTGIPIGSLGPSRARLIERVRRTFDMGTSDTGTSDTGTSDTGTSDTGAPDTARPDTSAPDIRTPAPA